jgi:hypothetical protein
MPLDDSAGNPALISNNLKSRIKGGCRSVRIRVDRFVHLTYSFFSKFALNSLGHTWVTAPKSRAKLAMDNAIRGTRLKG